jgi:hypothetical protein
METFIMNKFELVVQKTIPWNGNGMKIDKTLWNGMEVE